MGIVLAMPWSNTVIFYHLLLALLVYFCPYLILSIKLIWSSLIYEVFIFVLPNIGCFFILVMSNLCCCFFLTDMGWWDWMFPTLVMWLLNGTIVAAVMTQMFIFGEPVTRPRSESSVCYWRHRKQADKNLARVCDHIF